MDSQFRDLDPTDPFDVARAENVRFDTASGAIHLVNRPKGFDSYGSLAAAAVAVSVLGVPFRVAGEDHLVAMKLAAGRPRDLQDVADLTADDATG